MTHMAGGFSVDPERAPEAIRDLEFARAQLADVRQEALTLGTVDPGSRDSVSADAARVIGMAAVGGPHSLVNALEAGIQQLDDLISSLRADMDEYTRTELESTRRFDAGRT